MHKMKKLIQSREASLLLVLVLLCLVIQMRNSSFLTAFRVSCPV